MRHSIFLVLMVITLLACDQPRGSWAWSCRATHDIQCSEGDCEIAEDQGIVPIDSYFDASGKVSMCVYSGCWEGDGQIQTSKQFHSVRGENLPWSSPDIDDYMDVFVSVDVGRGVGVALAGPFAVPMICENSPILEEE